VIDHKLTTTHNIHYFGSYKSAQLFLINDQIHGHTLVNIHAPRPERTVRYLLAMPLACIMASHHALVLAR
jgi:hypothetical protein